jgi:hypothetical protein
MSVPGRWGGISGCVVMEGFRAAGHHFAMMNTDVCLGGRVGWCGCLPGVEEVEGGRTWHAIPHRRRHTHTLTQQIRLCPVLPTHRTLHRNTMMASRPPWRQGGKSCKVVAWPWTQWLQPSPPWRTTLSSMQVRLGVGGTGQWVPSAR